MYSKHHRYEAETDQDASSHVLLFCELRCMVCRLRTHLSVSTNLNTLYMSNRSPRGCGCTLTGLDTPHPTRSHTPWSMQHHPQCPPTWAAPHTTTHPFRVSVLHLPRPLQAASHHILWAHILPPLHPQGTAHLTGLSTVSHPTHSRYHHDAVPLDLLILLCASSSLLHAHTSTYIIHSATGDQHVYLEHHAVALP